MIVRSYQTPHQARVVPLAAVNGSTTSVRRQRDYIWIRPAPRPPTMLIRVVPSIEEIQRATAEQFGLTIHDMKSQRRSIYIARPRQVAMYLAAALTSASLAMIGRCFGGRDHSTVIHALRRVEELLATERHLARDMRSICAGVARAVERRDWEFRRGR